MGGKEGGLKMEHQNVFISHHRADDDQIKKVKDLLSGKGKSIKNSSIDSTKPNNANNEDYIRSILRPRIEWASCMLVLIGEGTHSREWVNWEIEEAERQGKRIVGLYLRGGTENEIPEALSQYANAVVGWNSERLIDALEGKYDNWETPEGEDRPSPWINHPRSNC